MFDADPSYLAVRTSLGTDFFARHQDDGQRRARYSCLATLAADGTLNRHEEGENLTDDALQALARDAGQDTSLLGAFALGDQTTWPRLAAAANPLRVFLYLDFFRAWQVADLAAERFQMQLRTAPDTLLEDIGHLPAAIMPLYQFNMTQRARDVARDLLPALAARLNRGRITRERADQAGYALRMLGDLCLRARTPEQAQVVFSLACDLGDNPFRRKKAIEAALAAGQTDTARRHVQRYGARWPVPAEWASLAGDSAGSPA